MNIIIIFITFLVIYLVTGYLLTKFGLKGLECSRQFSSPAVFTGEDGELVEVVRNDRPMLIPWLRMESNISPHLRLGRQENLNVSDSRHYSSLFTLMPYQQVRRRHKVHFGHRGAYDLGNATLTIGDVLGLFQANREQQMQVPVLVFPRLLEENQLPRPLSLLLGEMTSRRQLLTDPFLVRGIRTYQIGDPVRDIHWPATARMGEAQVRQYDYTIHTRLMVILNVQRTDDQWGDNLMEYEENEIEYGISMAATLCIRALRSGLAAGFAANMPVGEEKSSVILLPDGNPAREEELLTTFARLTILRTLSFPYFLKTLTNVEDMDVVVLSCYDSEELQLGLNHLRSRNNRVTLHLLEMQPGGAA